MHSSAQTLHKATLSTRPFAANSRGGTLAHPTHVYILRIQPVPASDQAVPTMSSRA